MKKFFVSIWKWILSLFIKKEVVIEKKETLADKLEKRGEAKERHSGRIIPKHNNRRTTKGRFIQYIDTDGSTRPIYHGAK